MLTHCSMWYLLGFFLWYWIACMQRVDIYHWEHRGAKVKCDHRYFRKHDILGKPLNPRLAVGKNDVIALDAWWGHDIETLSALLALCVGNPPVTGGFPSQRASNVELWYFLCCYPECTVEQSVWLPVLWDGAKQMWHHGVCDIWLQWSWRWSWTVSTVVYATPASIPTPNSSTQKALAVWPSQTSRATSRPSVHVSYSSSTEILTKG